MARTGKFVTLEGGEGTGKSTQATILTKRLKETGIDVVQTREPGGTPGAEVMRHLLKSGAAKSLGIMAEAIIVSAARNDHLMQLIRPALAEGKWVVCDRFSDSTRVYQGIVGGLEPEIVDALERTVVGDDRPDLTVLLDAPAEAGIQRAQDRLLDTDNPTTNDRFDQEDMTFHKKLRDAFLSLARAEPDRFVVIDANQPIDDVAAAIWAAVRSKILAEA